MTKSDPGLSEPMPQTPSRGRDVIPCEEEYGPRIKVGTGAENGATLGPTPKTPSGSTEGRSASRWSDILTAASNPHFRQAEFVRLILGEMSSACHELSLATRHSSLQFKVKPLTAEIRALRTLAETAHELTEVAAQSDVVNIDGPKFLYVYGKMIGTFKESMIQAGCNALICETVIRLFANNWMEVLSEVRRDIEKAHTLAGNEKAPG